MGGHIFLVSGCPLVVLQVKPTLQRLKGTLLGSGTALVLTAGVLFGLVTSGADADGMYGKALLCCRLFNCVAESQRHAGA